MATIQRPRTPPSRRQPSATDAACANDGDLLQRFIDFKDEAAFDELVRRHGQMVLGVCQRVLHNSHDADDCFQAAFMVLVRKATAIQPRSMVGNWLYGVAYRTALEARKMAARRRVVERKQPPALPAEPAADRWVELRPVLDQELARLPDKYRVVLIACDIQGKTRQQAAQHLDLPEGTVASRLARARALLAKRLERHRITLSAVTLGMILSQHAQCRVGPAAVGRLHRLRCGADGSGQRHIVQRCDLGGQRRQGDVPRQTEVRRRAGGRVRRRRTLRGNQLLSAERQC